MASLLRQWQDALAPVILRHPSGISKPMLELSGADGAPQLCLSLDVAFDTSDLTREMRRPFRVSTVRLTYFPGVRLAQAWIAAAWVGYLQHEALELATIGDLKTKILDPHAEPYETNPYNRGLRDGLPVELTPETLQLALEIVMAPDVAARMIATGR